MIDFKNLRPEDYLKIFWRRRWYVMITTVLVTFGVILFALWLPNIYKSETTILVEPQGISEGYVKPTRSERSEDRLNLIIQELKSRALLERVIGEFKLYGLGGPSPFYWENRLKDMAKDMDVSLRSRDTFALSFLAPDPRLARDVTKRLAELVIESQTSSREDQAVGTDLFLDEQLKQAEKALANQEEKLKAFKLSHLGALPEQSAASLAALNGLHSQLIANESALQRAQDQEVILEQRLQDLKRLDLLSQEIASKSGSKDGAAGLVRPESKGALRSQLEAKRGQLAELTLKYTDKFPDVVRLKREIQDMERRLNQETPPSLAGAASPTESSTPTISPSMGGVGEADISSIKPQILANKGEVAIREKEHEEVLQQIRVYQNRLNLSPRVEQELLALTRDHESLKQNYRNLQDKKFNAQVAANLERSRKNESFRIIDEAYIPTQPLKPDRPLIAFFGLLGGVVVGLGLVAVVEYLDPTLGDEDIAASELNLPVLVLVPEIQKNGKTLKVSSGRGQRLLKQA